MVHEVWLRVAWLALPEESLAVVPEASFIIQAAMRRCGASMRLGKVLVREASAEAEGMPK